MGNLKSIIFTVMLLLPFEGCTDKNASELKADFDKKAAVLKDEIEALKTTVDIQRITLESLEKNVTDLQLSQRDYSKAIFDASSKGYSRIDTNAGMFLISLMDVKPYVGGYKLFYDVGNLTSANYLGFKINIKWGKKFDWKEFKADKKAYENWEKSLKKKEISFTEVLRSGAWNKVEIPLPNTKSEELNHIEFSLETNTVGFGR